MTAIDTAPDSGSAQLSKSLRGRHLTMISIGGIIGAGLFVSSATPIRTAGPASFLSYAICGLLILLVMRMLGEMTTSLPSVRSFTEFARAGLGDGAGFVVGWLYWYFWVLVVPVEAIAGARIIQDWLPAGLQLSRLQIGLGLMTVMTAVNLMSARSYAEFEFWFASIKVAAILVFIVLAACFAFGWMSPHVSTFGNLVDHGGFTPHGWTAVLAAVPTVFFAMTGAEITTIAAAESAQPGKAVARMSTTVILRILLFYVGSLFFIVSVIPWTSVSGGGVSPFTQALDVMHIPRAGALMSVIILTAVLSCLNSAFYVSSRVLFILADRGDAPQALVRVNRRRVPTISVLIGAAAGFLGIIAATEAPQQVFDFLVASSGALVVFVYMTICFSQIALRRRREAAGEPPPAVRMWLFPWLSYAAIGAMAAVLIAMAITEGMKRDFYTSLVSLAVAVLAYLVVRTVRQPRVAPSAAG